jgi:hypothetical protein
MQKKKGTGHTGEVKVNLNWSKKFRRFITFSGRANSKEGIGVIGFESEGKQKIGTNALSEFMQKIL